MQMVDVHCCHMSTAIKHIVPDRVKPSFVIFDIWVQRQSAQMSKITYDALILSGTGCFTAVLIYPYHLPQATMGIKGLMQAEGVTVGYVQLNGILYLLDGITHL